MFVRDFYPQAKRAFENCSEPEIFARLTDAVKLLANKGVLDINLGQMDLCVCNGCATLPRDVGTVLGMNVNGRPTLIHDQWFQYHINGPGSLDCPPCNTSYELGQFVTWRDPSAPSYLVAEVTSAADNNKRLRVYALDVDGKKIYTPGPNCTLEEGFLVPTVFGFSGRNPEAPPLSSIYRVDKETTRDFVRLIAVNASDGSAQTQIGCYEPDETLPSYRRIRVPNKSWVRIKYKKANNDIRRLADFINLDNYEALRLACRAVKYRDDDKWDQARAAEAEATRILSEEAESLLPSGPRVPQIINGVFNDNGDSLFYSSGGDRERW